MAHTLREKEKLTLRVRRIRGQIDAIERALGEEGPHLIEAVLPRM